MGVQVLSYQLIKDLDSSEKIKKIIGIVKKGDMVMLEGKLTSDEELALTSGALESVSGKFSGVEIAYLSSSSTETLMEKVKNTLLKAIANDRIGITVIGPSKSVKEIKMDPDKLEVLFK